MRPADRVWPRLIAGPTLMAILIAFAGCHSHHIEATIENHTGNSITLLEVDYPSASFGADIVPPDGVYHHRIQTRGSGPISVQYTASTNRAVQLKGPTLQEGQEGSIEIVLLPDGKAEFHLLLKPQP
jgi:hypothetical protein